MRHRLFAVGAAAATDGTVARQRLALWTLNEPAAPILWLFYWAAQQGLGAETIEIAFEGRTIFRRRVFVAALDWQHRLPFLKIAARGQLAVFSTPEAGAIAAMHNFRIEGVYAPD